jgi:hypothetical protein
LLPLAPFSPADDGLTGELAGPLVDGVVPETVPAAVSALTAGLVVTAPFCAGGAGGVLDSVGVLAAALPAPAVVDSTAAVATVRSSPVVSFGAVSGLSGEVTSCP